MSEKRILICYPFYGHDENLSDEIIRKDIERICEGIEPVSGYSTVLVYDISTGAHYTDRVHVGGMVMCSHDDPRFNPNVITVYPVYSLPGDGTITSDSPFVFKE